MTFQIFVKSQQEDSFVASVIGLPECVVEGATKEEAVANARDALARHLSQGEIVSIEVENVAHTQPDNPWLKMCGVFADDPTWDDFLASMEEYRRELDAEEAAREITEHLKAA